MHDFLMTCWSVLQILAWIYGLVLLGAWTISKGIIWAQRKKFRKSRSAITLRSVNNSGIKIEKGQMIYVDEDGNVYSTNRRESHD